MLCQSFQAVSTSYFEVLLRFALEMAVEKGLQMVSGKSLLKSQKKANDLGS